MLRRRLLQSTATLTVVALMSACSGSDTTTVTPEQAIAAAREKLATAKYVTISLSTKDFPAGQNGVSDAAGSGEFSATEPKFKGRIQGRVKGISANLEMIAIGDKAWWKLFTPDYTVADLAGVGAPNPASLFDPEKGVPGLLAQATAVQAAARARVGKDVVSTYSGTIPGRIIKDLLFLGDGTKPFDITFGITESGELRQAVTTGEFFPGTTSTYTLLITDYGKAVTITAPQ